MEKQHEVPVRRFNRFDALWLAIILIIALVFRLYKINTPLADWHSWRQTDTAAVARNFVHGDFNLLYPRFDDLSNIQSGQFNPEGYRFVEFPLYNALFAGLYKTLPVVPIEIYGRLVTIFFSLIIIGILYYLLLHEHSRVAAISGAGVYTTFPFFVYYSRVVLPETTAVALAFIAIFLSYVWAHSKGKAAILLLGCSMLSASLCLLVKPTAGFYLLPVIYVFFIKYRFGLVKKPSLYLYAAMTLIPFILWRLWINHHPEAIPGFEWLITSVNTFEGSKAIFFKPAFFRWIFYERILLLVFGGYAIVFPLLGIIEKSRRSLLLQLISLSALVYLFTFQGGNVQHDYYQTIALPAFAIVAGIGITRFLRHNDRDQHIAINIALVVCILAFSWAMSYYKVKDNYGYSEDLVNIGKIINTLTPRDAKVITDRDGDTTLLYLANRKGMPAIPGTLKDLKENHGMQYFYTDKPELAKEAKKDFTPIFENSHVFIFKL